MTVKQRDYINRLMEEECEFGAYGRTRLVITKLGGDDWEKNYEKIPNSTVSEVIDLLKKSIYTSTWAVEHGYD